LRNKAAKERKMKNNRCVTKVTVVVLLITAGIAGAEEKNRDLGLGFFSGYNEELNIVTILASYNEWDFAVEEIEPAVLAAISPGSLVEFTFYQDRDAYIVTDIVDYNLPTPKEYERIVIEYQRKRAALMEEREAD
jgi:hypothetical protein